MTAAVVITAAGSGTRLGYSQPKALVLIAGKSLLEHALQPFLANPEVAEIIVTAAADQLSLFQEVIDALAPANKEIRLVTGGVSRQQSVYNGLLALSDEVEEVLIHDAARPFVPASVINRVLTELKAGKVAVVPALLVTDTIKEVSLEAATASSSQRVISTLNRSNLRAVQTPQGFQLQPLLAAHLANQEFAFSEETAASDDALLMEEHGHQVWTVLGDAASQKVTTQTDLAFLSWLKEQKESPWI